MKDQVPWKEEPKMAERRVPLMVEPMKVERTPWRTRMLRADSPTRCCKAVKQGASPWFQQSERGRGE